MKLSMVALGLSCVLSGCCLSGSDCGEPEDIGAAVPGLTDGSGEPGTDGGQSTGGGSNVDGGGGTTDSGAGSGGSTDSGGDNNGGNLGNGGSGGRPETILRYSRLTIVLIGRDKWQ